MSSTKDHRLRARARRTALGWVALCAGLTGVAASQDAQGVGSTQLEETRIKMGKWMQTQQLISKERKDWQQGKEVLAGRIELVQQELGTLQQKVAEARTKLEENQANRAALSAKNEELKSSSARLAQSLIAMEAEVKRLYASVPEHVQQKLLQLYQRIPEDPANTKATVAERFQNVLGILNELNKSNGEIVVNYEIHELAGGRPAEVKALYVGLAQAYYVSSSGEAGIGRPTSEGWRWEPSAALADEVVTALEILEGKHSPAFVPLPARLQ